MEICLLLLVIWPMLGALIGYLIGRKNKKARNLFADIVVAAELLLMLLLSIKVLNGEEMELVVKDFCGMGMSFALDGFRVVYGMVAAFMWFMTTLFSNQYFAHYRNRNRYYFFTLLTLGATIGVFLSADLYTTFIFFEMMSFTSYAWVAHDEKKGAIKAANTYLAVAVIGGLVILMGLFILYVNAGTLNISDLYEACLAVDNKAALYAAGGCLLFGFGAKAGMFLVHIWLPKAHPVAPAPASALLSGILTKTGVFGILAVSCNVFRHDPLWGEIVLAFGVLTMVLGAILAVFSVDFKRTLACSSMSQIGFILVGVGMQGLLGEHNSLAVRGTLLHMVNHSLIKLALFMIAGVIVMNLHKLNLNDIRGFGRKKPLLKISFLMGALGISGMPLWNGYVSKTLLHESIVEYQEIVEGTAMHSTMVFVEWAFLISGGLTFAYMLKLFIAVFVEKNTTNQAKMDESNGHYMNGLSTFAIAGSAILLPILGFVPSLMDKIADIGQEFMHGHSPEHAVHYFSLVNLKGACISLAIGAVVYVVFIRGFLMKKNAQGVKEYINRWPEVFDLEDLVYRPVLLIVLPFIGAFLSRCLDCLVDGIVILLRKTILKPKQEKVWNKVGTKTTYAIGKFLDDIVLCLNKTIRRNNPITKSFVSILAFSREEVDKTTKIVSRSVSFGLLMFCVGLFLTLAYLLGWH